MSMTISSITQTQKSFPGAKNHPFNANMQTMFEAFKERGTNVFSKNGYQELLANPNDYELLKNELFGNITDTTTHENLSIMMDNGVNLPTYGEDSYTDESGTVGNVTTYAYLNGPVLRAIWARSIVAQVMNIVPLKNPTYTLTFDVPKLLVNGQEYSLPNALTEQIDPILGLTPLVPRDQANVAQAGAILLKDKSQSGNLITMSLTGAITELDGYRVDREIKVIDVKYMDYDTGTSSEVEKTLPLSFKLYEIEGPAGRGIFLCEFDRQKDATNKEHVVLTINFDLVSGNFSASCTSDKVKSFKFDAYLSAEDNRNPAVLTTHQHSMSVSIGTGKHVMIDTPVELLQEYPTTHQGADYAVAMTDIISEMYAGIDNIELLHFLRESRKRPASSAYVPQEVLKGVNKSGDQFDVRVAHGENPSAYMDVYLKKCLSYHINEIMSTSRIMDGWWSIIGNALNVMLIPDFKTTSYAQGEMDAESQSAENLGFKVGYTLGFSTNVINGKVRCLYTPEIKKESGLIAFFSSSDQKRPTYLCHPFSYTISRGYQNPNNTTLPSTMVTKRRKFVEFVPSQFELKITGNDSAQWTNPKSVG